MNINNKIKFEDQCLHNLNSSNKQITRCDQCPLLNIKSFNKSNISNDINLIWICLMPLFIIFGVILIIFISFITSFSGNTKIVAIPIRVLYLSITRYSKNSNKIDLGSAELSV